RLLVIAVLLAWNNGPWLVSRKSQSSRTISDPPRVDQACPVEGSVSPRKVERRKRAGPVTAMQPPPSSHRQSSARKPGFVHCPRLTLRKTQRRAVTLVRIGPLGLLAKATVAVSGGVAAGRRSAANVRPSNKTRPSPVKLKNG